MATFPNMVLTTQGQALYSKVQTGVQLNFTRMQIGSGQLAQGQDPTILTALITPIAFFSINSITSSANTSAVKGIFSNSAITVSTYTCELGLFAQDPALGEILYAYANAGAQGDTIPPIASGPYSRQYQINVAIGNATNVIATIPAGTYIPVSDKGVAGGVASLDTGGQVPGTQLGNVPAVNAATTSVRGTVQVGASPAAGNPIVPSKVKEAKDVALTTTGAQVLATFTPTASGNFEVKAYFRVITGTTNVTLTISYADGTGARTDTVLNAQVCAAGNYNTVPWFFNAVSGTAITVSMTASVANQVYASTSIVGE